MEREERSGARERLAQVGAEALSDPELLALLLGTGGRGEPVEVLATRVLAHVGGLNGLEKVGAGELAVLPGLGVGKASRVVAALELGRRVQTTPLHRGTRITSSRDVARALRPRFARAAAEHFLAIAVDAKHRPIAELRIAKGGLTACQVAPGDVFRAVVREAAAAVVFVHNHPSGVPEPSPEDVALTDRLRLAGDLLGIRVLDHVILGHDAHFSFLDAGLLGERAA